MRASDFFLDKRVLVNGKTSRIHLDNYLKFSDMLRQVFALYPNIIPVPPTPPLPLIPAFENGLTYNTVTNIATWGGLLNQSTIIDGASLYSVDFNNIVDFTTNATNNVNFNAGNNVNITALNAIYNSANEIENYSTTSILNTAGTTYTTDAFSILENAVDIVNTASGSITENALFYTENADEIVNNATASIVNTSPIIRNDVDYIVNNASTNINNTVGGNITSTVTGNIVEAVTGNILTTVTGNVENTVQGSISNDVTTNINNSVGGDITNTVGGNLGNVVTGDIINSTTNIYNNADTSIINTTPYIFNNTAIRTTNATTNIANTTPTLTNAISTLYSTVNSVLQDGCGVSTLAFYKSGIGIATNFDSINSILSPLSGQFSAVESVVSGVTKVSGLYTIRDNCNYTSYIRSSIKGGANTTAGSTLEIATANGKLTHVKNGEGTGGFSTTSGTSRMYGTRLNTPNPVTASIGVSPDGVSVSGDDTVLSYSYRLPVKEPAPGDIMVVSNANGNQIKFTSNYSHIESRELMSVPTVGGKFTFLIPAKNISELQSITIYSFGEDAGTLTCDIKDLVTGTILDTIVIGHPPLPPNSYHVATTGKILPLGTTARYIQFIVTSQVDAVNINTISLVLNIKHTLA